MIEGVIIGHVVNGEGVGFMGCGVKDCKEHPVTVLLIGQV